MVSTLGSHRLADADLSLLATGELTADVIGRLRAAERSKHTLLVEGLRRYANGHAPADVGEIIARASQVLAQAQARRPEVVADLLTLPHVGFWATTCLSAARVGSADLPSAVRLPSSHDLAHLATFAAVAAVRTGDPFGLTVPVHGGILALPTLGSLRMGVADASGWARIRSAGRGAVVTVETDAGTVDLPIAHDTRSRHGRAEWVPAARIRVQVDGIVLDVVLETADPFLSEMCRAAAVLQRPSRAAWRRCVEGAWRILVRHHRPTAEALAVGLSTLVPLREPAAGRPVTAASGHAWGAIALSLPPDPLSCAEALVHEFQHLVLGAVEDVVPLVRGGDQRLHYAPWRDDPRPLAGLLQGSYAFFGLTGFWRRQRHVGRPADRLRGEAEFARGRREVIDAVRSLTGSPGLTSTGHVLARGMLGCLTTWQREQVSAEAATVTAEMIAEHRLRWRLAYLRPDRNAVDAIARAWLAGLPEPPGEPEPRAALAQTARPLRQGRSQLLWLRLRGRPELDRLLGEEETGIDAADAAFVRGDDAQARRGYLRRAAAGDLDAWVGLLLVRRRAAGLAADAPVPERPELIAAVYERVRALACPAADPGALVEWLAGRR